MLGVLYLRFDACDYRRYGGRARDAVPIEMSMSEAGSEIQPPMALVMVVPVLYAQFGRPVAAANVATNMPPT